MKKFFRFILGWFQNPQNIIAFSGLFLLGFLVLYGEYRVFWLLILTFIMILLFLIVLFIAGIVIVKQESFQFANVHFGGKSGTIWGVIIMIVALISFILSLGVLINLLVRPSF